MAPVRCSVETPWASVARALCNRGRPQVSVLSIPPSRPPGVPSSAEATPCPQPTKSLKWLQRLMVAPYPYTHAP